MWATSNLFFHEGETDPLLGLHNPAPTSSVEPDPRGIPVCCHHVHPATGNNAAPANEADVTAYQELDQQRRAEDFDPPNQRDLSFRPSGVCGLPGYPCHRWPGLVTRCRSSPRMAAELKYPGPVTTRGSGSIAQAARCRAPASRPFSGASRLRVNAAHLLSRPGGGEATTGASGKALRASLFIEVMAKAAIAREKSMVVFLSSNVHGSIGHMGTMVRLENPRSG